MHSVVVRHKPQHKCACARRQLQRAAPRRRPPPPPSARLQRRVRLLLRTSRALYIGVNFTSTFSVTGTLRYSVYADSNCSAISAHSKAAHCSGAEHTTAPDDKFTKETMLNYAILRPNKRPRVHRRSHTMTDGRPHTTRLHRTPSPAEPKPLTPSVTARRQRCLQSWT
jgi:hypothetical protein